MSAFAGLAALRTSLQAAKGTFLHDKTRPQSSFFKPFQSLTHSHRPIVQPPNMILTNCAACAAPLHPTNAKQCSRCKTRYCNATCQTDHWRRGHKQICKIIHRGGDAELYHADQKNIEAVAVAVAACADDTAGQTCHICLDDDADEGLVRMCACRGAVGFAHLSCLGREAKNLVDEVDKMNLGHVYNIMARYPKITSAEELKKRKEESTLRLKETHRVFNERWDRWVMCGLCEQNYHGVVRCALGWACWKPYLGRPEEDFTRGMALTRLGNGLFNAGHHEDALSVQEAELSMKRRLGSSEENVLVTRAILRTRIKRLDDLKLCACGKTYTPDS